MGLQSIYLLRMSGKSVHGMVNHAAVKSSVLIDLKSAHMLCIIFCPPYAAQYK